MGENGAKRMRHVLLLSLLSSLLALQAFGGDCFCLVDADDAVWFECREQIRPLRTQPLVFCTDAATGKQVELTGRQDLGRVADGDAPCTPCRLSDVPDLEHPLRGGDDEAATAGGAKDKAPPATGSQDATGEDRP